MNPKKRKKLAKIIDMRVNLEKEMKRRVGFDEIIGILDFIDDSMEKETAIRRGRTFDRAPKTYIG